MTESERPTVVIGAAEAGTVTISALGRVHGSASDFWDGNWLHTPVDIAVGGFTGDIPASLRAEEFRAFREELERVYADLTGTATLKSMEDWLHLTVAVEARGLITVTGRAIDAHGSGNQLHFRIRGLDQSYLPPVISALIALEEAFPVLGTPQ
ncbi:WapI family immunity protein [Actinoplanes sp. RD1]|uniref:WapI family immunity protein n=1 Tax=Actinoplanes sp. RD1 TaxID=3064538 RepID=UPI002740EB5B|nr:hypothetical protein [Actinoplanes sp. RD1]